MAATPDTRRRPRVAIAAAAVHLCFAAAGAMELDFNHAPFLIARYGALSGTDSSYGFFAPGVGTQLRVTFELTREDGTKSTDVLTTGASHEADLRIGDIVATFWMADENLRRSLVGSWAGRMLARHPEATRVVVHLDAYDLPTMAEYEQGERPDWAPHYEAEFVHRKSLGATPGLKPGGSP